jgi:hypothetical protein
MTAERFSPALKRAELLGASGVFLLGVGAGAWFGKILAAYAVALIGAGALLHALAMLEKHRFEKAGGMAPPWWSRMLYWLCWALLVMLALLMIARPRQP